MYGNAERDTERDTKRGKAEKEDRQKKRKANGQIRNLQIKKQRKFE
jgi:hypothetical protein